MSVDDTKSMKSFSSRSLKSKITTIARLTGRTKTNIKSEAGKKANIIKKEYIPVKLPEVKEEVELNAKVLNLTLIIFFF